MIVDSQFLDQHDMHALRTTAAFIEGRLQEAETVQWALGLTSHDRPQIAAVTVVLERRAGEKLREPWKQAWQLIQESWSIRGQEDDDLSEHRISLRLKSGERSSSLITKMVEHVSARVEVHPFSRLDRRFRAFPKQPSKVTDLFSVGIGGGSIVDPAKWQIPEIDDTQFMIELASALDSAVTSALARGKRMGWDFTHSMGRWGGIHRVHFVPEAERPASEHEPDEFSHGLAGSVKLLHATISRLAQLDPRAAQGFLDRWASLENPVHLRLRASLARDLESTDKLFHLLGGLDQPSFWDAYNYPEIAEFRASTFQQFSDHQQTALCARIKRGPPRSMWHKDVKREERAKYQLFMVLREFRRIELAGGKLDSTVAGWYKAQSKKFPQIRKMNRIDEGFAGTARARSVPLNPNQKFDFLSGEERLRALERALRSSRVNWQNDPAERASDWVRSGANVVAVARDLEASSEPGSYPKLWDRVGWGLTVEKVQSAPDAPEVGSFAKSIANVLLRVPSRTILEAIEGLTWWIEAWSDRLDLKKHILPLWRRMWPLAVDATNARQRPDEDIELTFETAEDSNIGAHFDTLNNPAGRLVGVFLSACPNLAREPHPFRPRTALSIMRNAVMGATGQAKLIGTHRILEALPYFLKADPPWAKAHLVKPLQEDTQESLVLWQAVARRTRFKDTLRAIGKEMTWRATDGRLSRTTRQSLVFSLVVECLHALRSGRRSAVPFPRVQQVIRSVEDEVRAHAANVMQQFLREVAGDNREARERLFECAIAPFLRNVWPQERSLATPGVARALADLPATTGRKFAEAVRAVSRFLVPFDAWSSMEYGLYGDAGTEPKLNLIDNESRALALLELLDATIGTAEGSVIPYDLAKMLDHISNLAPRCVNKPQFRRLLTATRT